MSLKFVKSLVGFYSMLIPMYNLKCMDKNMVGGFFRALRRYVHKVSLSWLDWGKL